MPIGYSAQCNACNSPHRGELDRRLLAGDATRKVSDWLQSEHGVRIPHNALGNHRRAHLDVAEEVMVRSLEAATAPFEAAVQSGLDVVATLDRFTAVALRVVEAHADKMADADVDEFDPAKVSLFKGCMAEGRAFLVAKHEILNGKKVNVDATASGGLAELIALAFEPSGGSEAPSQ